MVARLGGEIHRLPRVRPVITVSDSAGLPPGRLHSEIQCFPAWLVNLGSWRTHCCDPNADVNFYASYGTGKPVMDRAGTPDVVELAKSHAPKSATKTR